MLTTPPFRLTGVFVYPVKSMGGMAVDSWPLDRFGPAQDRRFMVVTPDSRLVTQREQPRLALARARVEGEELRVTAPGMHELVVPLTPVGPAERVVCWADTMDAVHAGGEAEDWLMRLLGVPMHLVHMPDHSVRPVPASPASDGERVTFVDAFPILVIGEASLADLNARLPEALPMKSFRPNLVVSGSPAYDEDRWTRARVSGVELKLATRCGRCAISTIDQETAERGVEPLKTLATFRRDGANVRFGRYAIHTGAGTFVVGSEIEILEREAPPTS